jgi:hypothetical protein
MNCPTPVWHCKVNWANIASEIREKLHAVTPPLVLTMNIAELVNKGFVLLKTPPESANSIE